MKTKSIAQIMVGAACACLFLATSSFASSGNASPSGRLIVKRIANFGNGVSLLVSVDGKHAATVLRGQKYDGWLTPGKHVVSATTMPNYSNSSFQTTIDVKAGQTYFFTATWRGNTLALVRNE